MTGNVWQPVPYADDTIWDDGDTIWDPLTNPDGTPSNVGGTVWDSTGNTWTTIV